jgi:hypothetical protein
MGKRRAPAAAGAARPGDGHGHCPKRCAMRLPKPHLSRGPRRDAKRRAAPPPAPIATGEAAPAREPDDEHAAAAPTEAGFRASSYELKRGLDVVELPTSLPPDVLDRLFKSPSR